jgi:hypothetical protein
MTGDSVVEVFEVSRFDASTREGLPLAQSDQHTLQVILACGAEVEGGFGCASLARHQGSITGVDTQHLGV